MDMRRFVEGYRSPANHHFNQDFDNYDAAVDEQMEGSRRWASFFDEHLTRFLDNDRGGDGSNLRNELLSYRDDWVSKYGRTLYSDILNLSQTHPEALRSLNEFNFHALNVILVPMWYRMLGNQETTPMQQPTIVDMQLRLAQSGTSLQILRDKYRSQHPDQTAVSDNINGQLTEIDSAIILLEVARIDAQETGTDLVVVPAPPQYDAGYKNKRRACDFVIMDVVSGDARGVQSKTQLRKHHGQEYDSHFVTFIDGMEDLKNKTLAVPHTVQARPTFAPLPGLVALDYILNRTTIKDLSRNRAHNHDMPGIIKSHAYAKAHFGSRKSIINQAGYELGNRILEDLYGA